MELKNTLNLPRLSSRFKMAQETLSNLEYKSIKSMQSKETKIAEKYLQKIRYRTNT